MSKPRKYRQLRRAETQEQTRQRIVEATMHLHEEIGPRATTISAIAERAGVQRLTVYRHFADETAIFQACTSHWLSLNPLPDPAGWQGIADPEERIRAALSAMYAYYRGTERMWTVGWRDEEVVPALREPMQAVREFLGEVGAGLARGLGRRGAAARKAGATINHALAFSTWRSLKEGGLDDKEMADLATGWIFAA